MSLYRRPSIDGAPGMLSKQQQGWKEKVARSVFVDFLCTYVCSGRGESWHTEPKPPSIPLCLSEVFPVAASAELSCGASFVHGAAEFTGPPEGNVHVFANGIRWC